MRKEKISIASPACFQVFQRQTKKAGRVLINGSVNFQCDQIDFRITGADIEGDYDSGWNTSPVCRISNIFSTEIVVPAGGWYHLTIKAFFKGHQMSENVVEKFGVGEVFIGAGQSNSTNCGEYRTKQKSGMVSSFNGFIWQITDDPFTGTLDKSDGGSYYPAFGDAIFEKYKVPVGIASTGFGGTSVTQWQPYSEYFNWSTGRMRQMGIGGFRAVLWHQGETDSHCNFKEYFEKTDALIKASWFVTGWKFPWFVAQATYHNIEKPADPLIRQAQARLWSEKAAIEGPDTDVLTEEYRDQNGDGIHFNPLGLKVHGEMWAEKVGRYLDEVFNQE